MHERACMAEKLAAAAPACRDAPTPLQKLHPFLLPPSKPKPNLALPLHRARLRA